jgi:hypothetical protein
MKMILKLVCLFWVLLAEGATYYVRTDGNNSNDGSANDAAHAWLTVQHAADVMVAGDTVIVQAGTYAERVSETTSGTAGNPITYTTNGLVHVGGYQLTGNYVTVDGFDLTGASVPALSAFVLVQANNVTLRNLSVVNPAHTAIFGIRVMYGNYTNCWMENIRLTNLWYVNFMMSGNYCTITNCSITSTTSWDAFRILGSNNRIIDNHVTMTRGTDEEHTDLFQAYTTPGDIMTNNVIEGNLFGPFDMQVQPSMIDDDSTGHCADWTWRNNVFIGPSAAMHIQVPNFKFYNNVFYGMFTDSGITLTGDPGWAYANNTIFRNNLWVECGEDPDDPYIGWYTIGSGVTGTDSDYNLVIGTGGGTTKIGFVAGGREVHSLNGVSPLFVDPGSFLAPAYKLEEGSPCLNAGTTIASFNFDYDGTTRPQGAAWDMGAYESGAGEPPDVTPPTPDPMTWSSVPTAISSSAITMVASTATDAGSPPVAYYFDETTGGPGATDSGWQSSATYMDSGLTASTLYTYRVRARDTALNETAWSSSESATTEASVPTVELRATTVTGGSVAIP